MNTAIDWSKYDSILQDYYADGASKLRKMVDKILFKHNWILDNEEMYSLADEIFVEILPRYDEKCGTFDGYLYSCLSKRLATAIRNQNRFKRSNTRPKRDDDGNIIYDDNGKIQYEFLPNVSLDADINESKQMFGEMLSRDDGRCKDAYGENVDKYLSSLSGTQRKIAKLIMQGYEPSEIKKDLHISDELFEKAYYDMRSFEKAIILKETETSIEDNSKEDNEMTTFEKSKQKHMTLASIMSKIDSHKIRFDHPLQRPSDQWTNTMKGNYISDIIQGNPFNPLIFAEEIINGLPVIWDIDGKQRCTTAHSFIHDGFKISQKVRRGIIKYMHVVVDDNGEPVLDENGDLTSEECEFDIRNKKFSQLPDDLKEVFRDYTFSIEEYINCSKEDIAYHIARYNEGKPMSANHKGIIKLGESFANSVKAISAMPFFKEQGGYTVTEAKGTNGVINRVVVESIMASSFLNDWKKKQEDACEFLRENATSETFENFEDMVDRFSAASNEEVNQMFTSKDTFIYFGLFARFVDTGLDDEKFIEFMAELSQSLHSKEINGKSYDYLCEFRNTKDKSLVVEKIEFLTTLMMEFLGLNTSEETLYIEETHAEEVEIADDEPIDVLAFVQENVDKDAIQEDIDFDREVSKDYMISIKEDSVIHDKENEPSVLAIVRYCIVKDINDNIIEEWFADYDSRHSGYLFNQKENYLEMKDDLDNFVSIAERRAS